MEIALTDRAVKEGVLRVWLRRVPEEGGMVHAFTDLSAAPVASAALYGRGAGSQAKERAMLLFRLTPEFRRQAPSAGTVLKLQLQDGAAPMPPLEVLAVE